MTDFKNLETLVWVATLGSFRGAAAKLNTTQPAISQRIAQLEQELGVRLLDRQARVVAPTEKGRELLAYADRLLRLRAEMRAAIADKTAVAGTLRLGVAETIVHTWLSRFIERVSLAYPRLEIEIEVDISVNLREQLIAHEIDMAFLLGPLTAPSIRNRPLCRYPIAFLASPRLGLPDGPVTLERLTQHPIITFSRRTQPYVALRELFSRPDLPRPRLHASASLATVVRMANDGIGVAAIPPAIVAEELADGRLRLVETAAALPELVFTASWPVSPDSLIAELVAEIASRVAEPG